MNDECPQCGGPLILSAFDTSWRIAPGKEIFVWKLPAGFCKNCKELYVTPEMIDLLDLEGKRCIFAIENDTIYRGRE